ncbi:MAG: right-handed parallel beta-helix repeat-containing protein [Parachlamydia sp.]|nr:right-handed parallel beta-helix repeat-containing protein [Parachlamydia sp.]
MGIFVEKGTDCLFDECEISQGTEANIRFDTATQCTVKNCLVNNATGDGIVLNADAQKNALLGNVVSNNVNGIVINTGASKNHLQDNKVFGNSGVGINNQETDTETYFNTSCNNGTNCIGVFPVQLPGDPAQAGSNICCQRPVKVKKGGASN